MKCVSRAKVGASEIAHKCPRPPEHPAQRWPRSLDLDAAARSERPSILLQMLVATLVKAGRLQAERSLTHRELTARAKFDDSSQRESFRRVAQLAERIVYGGDEAPAELDEVVQAGRALHSQLTGAHS